MKKQWDGIERRHHSKTHDWFYRLTVVGNTLVWLLFLVAMTVFHFARPEFVSGVQRYWGETGREEWNAQLTMYLYGLLLVCAIFSIILIFLRKHRNRRQNESWAVNLILLALVASGFSAWIYQVM